MFKTRLITALAVMTTLSVGNVVTAMNTTQEINEKDALVASIEATGTEVVNAYCTEQKLGHYSIAWKDNVITEDKLTMCTNHIGSNYALYMETLKHEAVHVAQLCTDTGLVTGKGKVRLARQVSENYDVEELLAGYDETHHHLELEAYALESQPAAHVKALVDMACNNERTSN